MSTTVFCCLFGHQSRGHETCSLILVTRSSLTPKRATIFPQSRYLPCGEMLSSLVSGVVDPKSNHRTASARDSVLRTAEVLKLILCHLSPSGLARCARVCHLWELPSLGLLWKELSDPRPLFRLLRKSIVRVQEPNRVVSIFHSSVPLVPILSIFKPGRW